MANPPGDFKTGGVQVAEIEGPLGFQAFLDARQALRDSLDRCDLESLAGDEVLERIGRILWDAKRSYDEAGRWGGKEFMLVLPPPPASTRPTTQPNESAKPSVKCPPNRSKGCG